MALRELINMSVMSKLPGFALFEAKFRRFRQNKLLGTERLYLPGGLYKLLFCHLRLIRAQAFTKSTRRLP